MGIWYRSTALWHDTVHFIGLPFPYSLGLLCVVCNGENSLSGIIVHVYIFRCDLAFSSYKLVWRHCLHSWIISRYSPWCLESRIHGGFLVSICSYHIFLRRVTSNSAGGVYFVATNVPGLRYPQLVIKVRGDINASSTERLMASCVRINLFLSPQFSFNIVSITHIFDLQSA